MKPRRTVAALLILAACSGLQGCSKGWPAFRHDALRTGNQFHKSRLSDPTKVTSLHIVWTFNAPGGQGFFASPVVHKGKVFIGNGNGFLYALNADTGAVIWQYPPSGGQALTSTFTCNPSSFGIASSATVTKIGGTEAVIFGAPDRSSGAHLGDGHLFALNAQTGALIWESPVLSRITGNGFNDFHEQIGYSSPLVFNGHVYIGIGDHCDNPIQNGRVVSVQLANGAIDPAFSYVSTSTRGGGVWTSPAALDDIYVTTGNTANGNATQPAVNHGLSLLRLDRNTGNIVWQHQPVPYALDDDPDWAAGAAVMLTSCGTLAVSQQKDGWAWSVETATGHVRWGFPTGPWVTGGFHTGDGTFHGDTDYKRPGAAWGDVYVASVGGLQTTTNLSAGYSRLHALNVCAPENRRIRWLKDVPATSGGFYYRLGPPTINNGIVFVGTSQGHLVVIGDPSLVPPVGYRCSNPAVPFAICQILGSLGSVVRLVPDPAVLKDIDLPGSGGFFGEPALVGDRVFIAGVGGKVFMLDVDP
ncbi:MAG TPA: PQQ-binding-like beta-propeller repeat protein [Terriglobales bacterium]|nr:PQQ-binding-like beta-propeller repeat protein [Terriglobales bacterium]